MDRVSMTAFGESLAALERAQTIYEKHRDDELSVTARNSLILEFEICFGQVRPVLQRALIELSGLAPGEIEDMNFASLVRTANDKGFLLWNGSSGGRFAS